MKERCHTPCFKAVNEMCSHFSLIIHVGYACRVLKMGKQGGKCNSKQPAITLSFLLLHINVLYFNFEAWRLHDISN